MKRISVSHWGMFEIPAVVEITGIRFETDRWWERKYSPEFQAYLDKRYPAAKENRINELV